MKDFNFYDLAFEAFLEGKTYDAAAEALYAVASEAFQAGWLATGGELPTRHSIEENFQRLLQRLREEK